MSFTIKHEFDAVTFGVFMVIAGFVFYCAAEMLLKKSFKVFSLKSLTGCAAFTVIMIVLLAVSLKTGFGIENRIPAASKVEQVTVSTYNYSGSLDYIGYPYDANQTLAYTAESSEDIEAVRWLHSFLLSQKGAMDDDFCAESYEINGSDVYMSDIANIFVTYQMKNGSTVERCYAIPVTPALLEDENSTAWACMELFDAAEKNCLKIIPPRTLTM